MTWTESEVLRFIEDNYDTLLFEEWIPLHLEEWVAFMDEIYKPLGRKFVAYDEAPLEIWRTFVRWHRSQTRFNRPFEKWIEDNLPIEDSATGGDGKED